MDSLNLANEYGETDDSQNSVRDAVDNILNAFLDATDSQDGDSKKVDDEQESKNTISENNLIAMKPDEDSELPVLIDKDGNEVKGIENDKPEGTSPDGGTVYGTMEIQITDATSISGGEFFSADENSDCEQPKLASNEKEDSQNCSQVERIDVLDDGPTPNHDTNGDVAADPSVNTAPSFISNESSSPTFNRQPVYDYTRTRVTSSPLQITIPDLEDDAETADPLRNSSDVECDSVGSYNPNFDELKEEEEEVKVEEEIIDSDIEEVETKTLIPKHTEEHKYYRISHLGQTYFLKVEKRNGAVHNKKQEEISLLDESLTECVGCRFKMPNVRDTHECVPDFCVPCQMWMDGDTPLHILENHMKDLITCPFCKEGMAGLQQLELHLPKHTSIKMRLSVCVGCKKNFKTTEGRVNHSCKNSLVCKYCNVVYNAEDKLADHLESQHKNEKMHQSVQDACEKVEETTVEGESIDGEYVCAFCDKNFSNLKRYETHVRWHLNIPDDEECDDLMVVDVFPKEDKVPSPEKHRCPHCTFSSADLKTVNAHLCSSKFCKLCLTQFGGNHEFETHMVECHCSAKNCQFCDEEFKDSHELIEHIKQHTKLEIRPFLCNLCGSNFNREESLQKHKCQGKSWASKLICKDCKIYFQSERALDSHLIEHHSQENCCPICKIYIDSAAEILKHMESHFTSSSVILDFCGKCMKSFNDDFYTHDCINDDLEILPVLEELNTSQASDSEHLLACSICGKEFVCEEDLEEHVTTTVEKAMKIAKKKLCTFCNVFFATRSSFESHLICKHLSALQCPFCLGYLSSNRLMEQHLLHHTNIHRNQKHCNTCRKIFFSQGLYHSHSCDSSSEDDVISGEGIRKFEASPKVELDLAEVRNEVKVEQYTPKGRRKMHFCPVCNLSFKGKKYLEDVHMPTHCEKNFTCSICQRKFKKAETLKSHLELHKAADLVKSSPKKDQEMSPLLSLPLMSVPEQNKCFPCRRVFVSAEELEKHSVIHSYSAKVMEQASNKVTCKICGYKMESEFWAAYHYTNSHNIIPKLKFKCTLCTVHFFTLSEQTEHFCPKKELKDDPEIDASEWVIKTEPVEVVDSVELFYNETYIPSVRRGKPVRLLKIDPLNLEHPCSHCTDVFVNARSLADHCNLVLHCRLCKKTIGDMDLYEHHMMYQHACLGECMFCGEEMATQEMLVKHLKVHSKLTYRVPENIKGFMYGCRHCSSVFRTWKFYERHNVTRHVKNRRCCPFCSGVFTSPDKLLEHIVVHTTLDVKKIISGNPTKSQKPVTNNKKEVPLPKSKKTEAAAPAKEAPKAVKKNKTVAVPEPSPTLKSKAANISLAPVRKRKLSSKDEAKPKEDAAQEPKILIKGELCLVCKKKVRSGAAMYDHVVELHWNNSKTCPFCGKFWNNPAKTKMHMNMVHKKVMAEEKPTTELPSYKGRYSSASRTALEEKKKPETARASVEKASSSKLAGPKSSKRSSSPPKSKTSNASNTPRASQALSCVFCAESLATQDALDEHLRSIHKIEPSKASLLHKIIATQEQGVHGPDKNTFCFHCHTSFNTPAELRAHGVKAGVFCEFCKKTLPDKNEFEMHMLEEHSMDDTCQFCGAYIPNKSGLEIHLRRHTNIGPIHYKCFGCSQLFKSTKDKDDHPCIAYGCPRCNSPQRGPDALEEHIKICQLEQDQHPLVAEIAVPKKRGRKPKKFTAADGGPAQDDVEVVEPQRKKKKTEEDNSSHASTQKSDGRNVSSNWNCSHCEKSFPNSKALVLHATFYKVYCKICKQVMPSEERLVMHSSIHGSHRGAPSTSREEKTRKEGPQDVFVCRFCGEEFNSYPEIDEHSKSHVINQCSSCFKVFDSDTQLQRHMRLDHENSSNILRTVKIEESDSDDDIMIIENKKPGTGQFVMG